MNRNTPFTDLHSVDFSTDEILYNEPFFPGKPSDPVEFYNELITPTPYDVIWEYILEQYGANYGSSYLPDVAFSISTPFCIEINLIKSTPRNNELFNLSQSEIERQYNVEAFKTDLKTYGYWLSVPDSKHSSSYWKSYKQYRLSLIPIHTAHYDGSGVLSIITLSTEQLYILNI